MQSVEIQHSEHLLEDAQLKSMHNYVDATKELHIGIAIITQKVASNAKRSCSRKNQLVDRRRILLLEEGVELLVLLAINGKICVDTSVELADLVFVKGIGTFQLFRTVEKEETGLISPCLTTKTNFGCTLYLRHTPTLLLLLTSCETFPQHAQWH